MTHVCIVGPIPPPWGGVQAHIVTLRERIQSEGWRCSLVNVTRHRRDDADDCYYPSTPSELLTRIIGLRPDIVHVHAGGDFVLRYAGLFVALSLMPGAASVFTFHSGGFPGSEEGRRASRASLRGWALRRLSAVIGVNRALVDTFERYGVAADRLHLIEPHTTALDAERVRAVALPEAIAAFAAAHSPLLLSVGLLEPEYGLDVQIDALPSIRERFPGAGLVMIGSGSLSDTLRERIGLSPVASHLLLAGDVPREQTLSAIARADVLLRTTHYDGDALSVREALALRTPVIVTDNGMRPAGVRLLTTLSADALAAQVVETLHSGQSSGVTAASDAAEPDPLLEVVALYRSLLGR